MTYWKKDGSILNIWQIKNLFLETVEVIVSWFSYKVSVELLEVHINFLYHLFF